MQVDGRATEGEADRSISRYGLALSEHVAHLIPRPEPICGNIHQLVESGQAKATLQLFLYFGVYDAVDRSEEETPEARRTVLGRGYADVQPMKRIGLELHDAPIAQELYAVIEANRDRLEAPPES
jgi:hypothetical protein